MMQFVIAYVFLLSLKYIHYNKDWDSVKKDKIGGITVRSLKYIHYNKDWDSYFRSSYCLFKRIIEVHPLQ